MDEDLDATTPTRQRDCGSAPHVLLVDDDELVLAHLQSLVRAAGFKVCTANGGKEALALMERAFSPVVISDLNMPGMDGLSLCRTIRQLRWPGYVYIVLLTAQNAEQDILAGLDAGADDYLGKRTSLAQLIARLRTAERLLNLEYSLKQALSEKRRLALTDALTGAPNRRYFQQRLSRDLARARRFGADLCLLCLDIDHFKDINDRHGHAAGDAVLQEFVRRIRRCLPRTTDWCARTGGEEFAVVLDDTNLAGVALVAERLRQCIDAAPVRTAAGSIPVTVSIGVSAVTAGGDRRDYAMEPLLQLADRNLYASKAQGRNRVTLPESSRRALAPDEASGDTLPRIARAQIAALGSA